MESRSAKLVSILGLLMALVAGPPCTCVHASGHPTQARDVREGHACCEGRRSTPRPLKPAGEHDGNCGHCGQSVRASIVKSDSQNLMTRTAEAGAAAKPVLANAITIDTVTRNDARASSSPPGRVVLALNCTLLI